MKTKPFNLKDTSFDTQYVTRSGIPVEILKFDARCTRPIIGLIKFKDFDELESWDVKGKVWDNVNSDSDLFILNE